MYIFMYIVRSIREQISTHPSFFYFRFTRCIYNVCFVILLLLVAASNVLARPQRYAHIAVIENDAYEESLPNALRNPFYKTPRVREVLAKSSWFGPGEEPVYERQAEKIPRAEIYNVLAHAGFISRRGKLI
ncbi:PREDICTED: uncharacterized protein LOC108374802 isoform X1 [Rhagoletis zephyria]|uniref:uncharacterized protein LOC108374802 isoform X1 n=1 Tax=Rhagoletis zephyria TaxID=28612 RepID=UPI0008112F02|nr:PREDICTED: uncharacterized protein LOC108374802 isoform X1 [Rhagoletis zephyria]